PAGPGPHRAPGGRRTHHGADGHRLPHGCWPGVGPPVRPSEMVDHMATAGSHHADDRDRRRRARKLVPRTRRRGSDPPRRRARADRPRTRQRGPGGRADGGGREGGRDTLRAHLRGRPERRPRLPFTYLAVTVAAAGFAPAALGSWVAIDVLWRIVAGAAVGFGVGTGLAALFFRARPARLRLAENG